MSSIKMISAVLLAVYIFFMAAFDFFNFQAMGAVGFFLGLAGVGSGVLMLISMKEWHHLGEKK